MKVPSLSSPFASHRTILQFSTPFSDTHYMDRPHSTERAQGAGTDTPTDRPDCVVCGREAVAIDRNDAAMCAKHAALFVTRDYRDAVADKARVVR